MVVEEVKTIRKEKGRGGKGIEGGEEGGENVEGRA